MYVEYESLPFTLSDKLEVLFESGRKLSENEFVQIFRAVVSSLIYLKKNQTCHGDLKPETIFFDNSSKVKLLDSFFVNGGKTSY